MKKCALVLLTFVPIVAGYFINLSMLVPVIGIVLYYALPLLMTAFWFYLGKQYARTTWKTVPAILIGNSTGILSLLLYLWQFLLETAATRNTTLAFVSQLFCASTPGYLLARIAMLFEKQSNYAGRTSLVALHVISVIYMIAVFCAAMLWEKKRIKNTSANQADSNISNN